MPTATAYMVGLELVVQLADTAWSAPLLPPIADAITSEGGLVLMLTSALNPTETPLTTGAIRRLLRSGDVAHG